MSDVLVRNVETPLLAQLKRRAKRNHRSLQAELKVILLEATARAERDQGSFEDAVRFADAMRRKFAGKITGDSTNLIREDRDRRRRSSLTPASRRSGSWRSNSPRSHVPYSATAPSGSRLTSFSLSSRTPW